MELANSYLCEYCNKVYKRKANFTLHLCRQKIRFQEQTQRGVQLGYHAFVRFFSNNRSAKTYNDFAISPYYNAFVKWGKYVVELNAIEPEKFLDWLITKNKKIDQWCKDSNYTDYLLDFLKEESFESAVKRALEYSLDWQDRTSSPAKDYLRYGNENLICYAISTGRISPWILYNSKSGKEFLSRLHPEQLSMIWNIVNSDFWGLKLQNIDKSDFENTLELLGW